MEVEIVSSKVDTNCRAYVGSRLPNLDTTTSVVKLQVTAIVVQFLFELLKLISLKSTTIMR